MSAGTGTGTTGTGYLPTWTKRAVRCCDCSPLPIARWTPGNHVTSVTDGYLPCRTTGTGGTGTGPIPGTGTGTGSGTVHERTGKVPRMEGMIVSINDDEQPRQGKLRTFVASQRRQARQEKLTIGLREMRRRCGRSREGFGTAAASGQTRAALFAGTWMLMLHGACAQLCDNSCPTSGGVGNRCTDGGPGAEGDACNLYDAPPPPPYSPILVPAADRAPAGCSQGHRLQRLRPSLPAAPAVAVAPTAVAFAARAPADDI